MTGLLEFIVRELVDDPSAVQVTEVESGDATVYEVRVADADRGKVIGRHGRTAQALRLVAKAVAGKDPQRVFVELIE